ncbi:MAG: NADH:ubiquinone reductase (Na(+)-transporting) subunit B [Bacteroidales bacterium]|nr:NADH:ubiquinone reductase (Na(+)-transporting) subunit B [Bacteroidales bacterium]
MKALRKFFDKMKPSFEEGGKLHAFRSLYEGFESFAFVPHATSRRGSVNVHDSFDSKRLMSFVVIALVPALLFGCYNIGYQNALAAGQDACSLGVWSLFLYGFLAMLPKLVVSYVVGLGIEFTVAQWKKEEIAEGYLVSGIIIPLIIPVNTPLWILALACAFSVIFAKEIFGGTGMNIFNVALIARAFLFFSYPSMMTGDDTVWVAQEQICGLGFNVPDSFSSATPLGQAAIEGFSGFDCSTIKAAIYGLIPGSMGETSVIAIGLGGLLLLCTGVASWKTMLSVFVGGAATGFLLQATGATQIEWWHHLVVGGFAFGAVFMATDPVTSARTEGGKFIYGFLIGLVAVLVRVLNPGFPEGMMLAILLMNLFAPLIDYFFVQSNINKRAKRATK